MEESSKQVGHAPGIELEYPIKKELCQPGQDSVQPVKRRRLRRRDMQVGGRNVEKGLDLHSLLKVKQEVKEEAQSMDEDILKGGGFRKEEADAGVCKIETGTAVKVEHAESSHQAGHECWQPKLRDCGRKRLLSTVYCCQFSESSLVFVRQPGLNKFL